MKHFKYIILLAQLLMLPVAALCDGKYGCVLPAAKHISAADFVRLAGGKGWVYVESHELRGTQSFAKRDYWSGIKGRSPVQYEFSGDSITTFMYIDSYPIYGYTTDKFTFDEATNSLVADGEEVMKVLSITDSEMKLVRQEAMTFGGDPVRVYAVYRAMTPAELAAVKENHPYNIETLDQQYPRLPEQQRITVDGFASNAVGYGWKCAEAHAMVMGRRYDASDFYASGTKMKPVDYYIAADSLTVFSTDWKSGEAVVSSTPYAYRANGFYIEAAHDSGFKIVSLTGDEMHVVSRQYDHAKCRVVELYCVYRRMTGIELASHAASRETPKPVLAGR